MLRLVRHSPPLASLRQSRKARAHLPEVGGIRSLPPLRQSGSTGRPSTAAGGARVDLRRSAAIALGGGGRDRFGGDPSDVDRLLSSVRQESAGGRRAESEMVISPDWLDESDERVQAL